MVRRLMRAPIHNVSRAAPSVSCAVQPRRPPCGRTARSRARALVGCFSAALFVASAREAEAQQCSNPLTSSCINADSFWPTAGPQRFAAVSGTETVAERQVAFGLVTTYLSRPVILRLASPGPGGSDQSVVDNQVTSNFLFAYGVTDRLQLDLALPITLVQSGAGTSPLTGGKDLRNTAVRDMRFGFAYAIVPRDRNDPNDLERSGGAGHAFAVTARFDVSAPIGDNSDFAGERTAVYVPSLGGDYRWRRFFFGAEVGARIRPVTEFAGARIGTQLTTSAGAGFDVLKNDRLSVLLEAHSYFNFVEQHETQQSDLGVVSRPNGNHITPAEWMLGVRSAPLLAGDISLYAGGGGPFPGRDAAITVPRFRFDLGITYAPMRRDTDGDGVPDRIDRCPSQPGEKGGEKPGCPKAPEPTPPHPEPKAEP